MYTYSFMQWIAFFAIYCFFGWIFESIYVSIEYRKLTNRGFLYGPAIPIYGFGAVTILFFTAPFKDNVWLTFISGMLAATVLEYVTGYLMEKIFGVRYWDYTYEPFNLNGYICLGCSLMWGMFSVLVTNYVHNPVDRFVKSFDSVTLWLFDVCFLLFFMIDLYASAKAAFDLKKLFADYVENNEFVHKMQKRLDVIIAFANDDYNNWQNMVAEKRKEYETEIDKIKNNINEFKKKFYNKSEKKNRRVMYIIKRNPGITSKNHIFEIENLKKFYVKKEK